MNLTDIIMRGAGVQKTRQVQPAQSVGPWGEHPDAPDPWVAPSTAAQGNADPWDQHPDAPDPWASGATATPAAAQPERTLIDQIMSGAGTTMNYIDRGVRGVAEGIVNVATLPVEGAALAGDIGVPMPPLAALFSLAQAARPYIGHDATMNALDSANDVTADALGVERPRREPEGMAERATERVGQEIGTAILPLGPILNKAREGVAAARELPSVVRHFVEPAAINRGKFVRKELGAAAAAGGGAALANEAFPNNRWADFLGAITGVGALGALSGVAKPLGNVIAASKGNLRFADEMVRDDTLDTIIRAAGLQPPKAGAAIDTQPLADQIRATPPINQTIPGFKESTADRTKNPGVAALEYSRQSGENSGMYTQRRAENTQAIDDAMSNIEPQGNAGKLRGGLENERNRRIDVATGQRQNAQDDFDRAIEPLRSVMTAEGRGADIRAALEGASEAARAVLREAWAPLNRSGQRVDVAPLAGRFDDVDQSLSQAETQRFQPREAGIPDNLVEPATPPQPSPILDAQGRPIMRPGRAASGMQPLNEVTGIRSALTDAQREADTAGRANEARVLGNYIAQIDSYMAEHLPADLQEQYGRARDLRRDFADRFERPQTAIAQTLDRQEGQYRLPDSAVPRKFVQSDEGRIADFEALMREAGNDDRVRTAVHDQILADVRDRGLLDNPQGLNRYLEQYGAVFNRFPELRQELGSAGNLRRQLAEATTAETDLRAMLTRQGRSAVADYLQYGNENADRAMQSVIAAKEPARAIDELLSFVNDEPAAVEGARKVFWDIMQKSSRRAGETTADMSGTQPWMPKAFKRFLDDPRNAAVAERLYRDNPEHLATIRKISDALQGVDTRNSGKAPNSSGTAQGMQSVLPSTETIASRVFAVKRGVVSPAFAALNIVAVMARRATRNQQVQALNKAVDRALLDPEFAAALAEKNNPANRAALARKAKLWMGNEAATIVDLLGDDRDRDPVKEAVMR